MSQCATAPQCREQEIQRRQTIQTMAIFIRDNKSNPQYAVVWRFLAGLVSTKEYSSGADYFWDAWQEHFKESFLPFIGLHPNTKKINSNDAIYHEMLAMQAGLQDQKTALAPILQVIQVMMQWQAVSRIQALNPIWDEKNSEDNKSDSGLPQSILAARRMDEKWQHNYQYLQRRLQWNNLPSLSLTLFIISFDNWMAGIEKLREKLLPNANFIESAERVRCAVVAATTLGNIGIESSEILAMLRQMLLQDKNADVRRAVIIALVSTRNTDAVTFDTLRQALRHEDSWVSCAAAAILVNIGSTDIVTSGVHRLRQALKDELDQWHCLDVLSVFKVKNADILATLCRMLKSERSDIRDCVYRTLGDIKANDVDTLTILCRVLQNNRLDSIARMMAARALGSIGVVNNETLAALHQALHDGDSYVCSVAMQTLRVLNPNDAKTPRELYQLLQEGHLDDQYHAIQALENSKANDAEILDALCQAMRQARRADIPPAAAIALVSIIGTVDAETLAVLGRKALVHSRYSESRCEAVRTLGNVGARNVEVLDVLRRVLQVEDTTVGCAAAKALGNLGAADTETLALLFQALEEKRSWASEHPVVVLKKVAPYMHDGMNLQCLLEAEKNDFRLEIICNLNIALLRVPLTTYLKFTKFFVDVTVQRFFVVSLWLQSASFSIDVANKRIILNDEVLSYNVDDQTIESFLRNLKTYQDQFIQLVVSAFPELIDILHRLNQPIIFPERVNVLHPDFLKENLPEEPTTPSGPNSDGDEWKEEVKSIVDNALKPIREELDSVKEQQRQFNRELLDIHRIMDLQARSIQDLEGAFAIIEKLQTRLAGLPESLWQVATAVVLSVEQQTYAYFFKKVIVSMHMTALVISSGLLQVVASGSKTQLAKIFSALSSSAPLGLGIGLKILGYCLQAADQATVRKRMANLSDLSAPDHIAQLSDALSLRLMHCLSMPNPVKEGHIEKLLSAAGDMISAFQDGGFYGALTQAVETVVIDPTIDCVVGEEALPVIGKRAQQDAQMLLAAVAEQGAPLLNDALGHIDSNIDANRLFLFAIPLIAVVDSLYLKIVDHFCQQQRWNPDHVYFNSEKRGCFYGRVTESWYANAAFVGEIVETDEKRKEFVTAVACGFFSVNHADGSVGVFYPGERTTGQTLRGKKHHASWNEAVLTAGPDSAADRVISTVIAQRR